MIEDCPLPQEKKKRWKANLLKYTIAALGFAGIMHPDAGKLISKESFQPKKKIEIILNSDSGSYVVDGKITIRREPDYVLDDMIVTPDDPLMDGHKFRYYDFGFIDIQEKDYLALAEHYLREDVVERYKYELVDIGICANPSYDLELFRDLCSCMRAYNSEKDYELFMASFNDNFIGNIRYLYQKITPSLLEKDAKALVRLLDKARFTMVKQEEFQRDLFISSPSIFTGAYKILSKKIYPVLEIIEGELFSRHSEELMEIAECNTASSGLEEILGKLLEYKQLFLDNPAQFTEIAQNSKPFSNDAFINLPLELDNKKLEELVYVSSRAKAASHLAFQMMGPTGNPDQDPPERIISEDIRLSHEEVIKYSIILGSLFEKINRPYDYPVYKELIKGCNSNAQLDDFFNRAVFCITQAGSESRPCISAYDVESVVNSSRSLDEIRSLASLEGSLGNPLFNLNSLACFLEKGLTRKQAIDANRDYNLYGMNITHLYSLGLTKNHLMLHDTDKPNCLFTLPQSDYNHAFINPANLTFFLELDKHYDVLVSAISSDMELCSLIDTTPDIELLVIGGHGEKNMIKLDNLMMEANKYKEKYMIDISDR